MSSAQPRAFSFLGRVVRFACAFCGWNTVCRCLSATAPLPMQPSRHVGWPHSWNLDMLFRHRARLARLLISLLNPKSRQLLLLLTSRADFSMLTQNRVMHSASASADNDIDIDIDKTMGTLTFHLVHLHPPFSAASLCLFHFLPDSELNFHDPFQC